MSTEKTNLAKVGPVEILTGVNTVGVLYLYYELNKLGTDINTRIGTISTIIKRLNNNINVINQHFMKHLYHHKTILDIDNQNLQCETKNPLICSDEIIMQLKNLEARILELESNINPILINNSNK